MAHLDTQQEGSGENNLIEWLKQNKLEKVKNKLMQNHVDLEEMIELNESELKEYAKNDLGLNVIEVKRFVKGIKKLQSNQKPEIVSNRRQKVIVSTEEEDAMRKCDDKYNELDKEIEIIKSNILKLKENVTEGANIIESTFNKLFEQLNGRKKELMGELDKISKEKKSKYTQKIEALKNTQKGLKNCKEKCEKLIFESDIDRQKRKIKILNMTDESLAKNDYENIEMPGNAVVGVEFPTVDDMIQNVTKFGGVIKGGAVPLPPIVTVYVDGYDTEVTISNVPNQTCEVPLKYKLEVAKVSNKNVIIDESNVDEMKLEWKLIEDNYDYDEESDEDEEYGLNKPNGWEQIMWSIDLELDTRYVVRCAVQNNKGLSEYSKIVSFTTLEEDEDY